MGGPVYKGLGRVPDRALLLFAGLMYAFLYAPILVLVIFSFNSTRSTQVWTGFSTEWYAELIRDQSILDAFRTSLVVGVTATVIATVIGTLTALAMTPGRMSGSVTRKNVWIGLAPRSWAASSTDWSIPESRARTTMVTNEMVNATCAMIMVVMPSWRPAATKNTSRLTPTTISGITVAA